MCLIVLQLLRFDFMLVFSGCTQMPPLAEIAVPRLPLGYDITPSLGKAENFLSSGAPTNLMLVMMVHAVS